MSNKTSSLDDIKKAYEKYKYAQSRILKIQSSQMKNKTPHNSAINIVWRDGLGSRSVSATYFSKNIKPDKHRI